MTPFTTLTSVAAPLLRDNVDTDTIIPSREMRSTGRTGLADGLFAPWRYLAGRTPKPNFVLNDPHYAKAQILLSGTNFGCGSSREHAVWALAEYGFRCIIAESFAPIFAGNCVRNGVLTIALPRDAVAFLAGQRATVDLASQSVTCKGHAWAFTIAGEAKTMLLEGLDAIALTQKSHAAITAFHTRDRTARPWVYTFPSHAKHGEGGGVTHRTPSTHFPPQLAGEGDPPQEGGGVAQAPVLPIKDGEGDPPKEGGGVGGVGGVARLPPRTNAAIIRARKLRRDLSPAEAHLWQVLRTRPGGLKFRRQHPAGPYVLDFYCAAARLAVEVDGEAHDRGDRPQANARRDAFMTDHGVATLRIPAGRLRGGLADVVAHIVASAQARLPLHPPQQAGEAGA